MVCWVIYLHFDKAGVFLSIGISRSHFYHAISRMSRACIKLATFELTEGVVRVIPCLPLLSAVTPETDVLWSEAALLKSTL